MTEEQIKQNAEEYANKHYDIPFEDDSSMNVIVSEESYIAGAHSRDEEVARLKAEIEDNNAVIRQLRAELAKAQNPWISVKERRPERMTSKDSNGAKIIYCCSKDVFGYDASYKIGRLVCYNHESEMWESHDAYTIGEITHWKPIIAPEQEAKLSEVGENES